ncbi:hypothetical protein JCM12294_18870 [Desulfocicer niacini]
MAPDGRRVKRKPHNDIIQQKKGKQEDKNTYQSSAPFADRIYYAQNSSHCIFPFTFFPLIKA